MAEIDLTDMLDGFDMVELDTVPVAPVISDEALQEQRKKVLNWLQPTDYLSPGNEYMKHRHAHIPGTGEWVQTSPIFRSWCGTSQPDKVGLDTDSGYHYVAPKTTHGTACLHIRGVAGSGKSVFSASTINQLQKAGHIVLFFFFRQIVDKNHAAKYLVRDFAAQLLPHCDTLVSALATLSTSSSISDVDMDSAWSAICKALVEGNVGQQVFCVVDALDEMDDADFPDMMEKLITLGFANPQTVKMMFTGRPLPKIELATQNKGIVQLKLDPVLLSPDVARYVDARMASLEPRLSDDRCNLVRSAICKRASGLFLHARLITDNLAQNLQEGRVTEETLPDSLENLPASLRDVYEQMLRENAQRSGVSMDDQAKILTCVTHASRPLRLIELGSLVAQMLNADLKRGKELVRASCGRLLELLEDETVSVIHHSFTEFLHDSDRSALPNAFPVLENAPAHDMFVVLCLEYLNNCPHFDPGDTSYADEWDRSPEYTAELKRREKARTQLRLSHPLATYAVSNLGFHFTKSANVPDNRGLKMLDAYFKPNHPAFGTWILMNSTVSISSHTSSMHLLLNKNEEDNSMPFFVFQHMVQGNPALVDLCDYEGSTALIIAAKLGRCDVMETLISHGANIEAGDNTGKTALHWAVAKERESAVKMLLEAGVDPLIKTISVRENSTQECDQTSYYAEEEVEEEHQTALSMAMRSKSLAITTQFLPFIPAADSSSFFHNATTAQSLEAILKTGRIDINSYGSNSGYLFGDEFETTKLFAVAASDESEMIKVLLDHGADPMRREPGQPTVLHAMARTRSSFATWSTDHQEQVNELVNSLVDAGADVNATMDKMSFDSDCEYTPLHLAVRRERDEFRVGSHHEEVFTEALLKAGADPNKLTSSGQAPIHLINPENTALVRVLVKYGARINQKDNHGCTALLNFFCQLVWHTAFDHLKPELVVETLNLLLDLGADPSTMDNCDNGIFHYILSSLHVMDHECYLSVVERLLQTTDLSYLNHLNKDGKSPIHCCQELNRFGKRSTGIADEILSLMIRSGLSIDSQNKHGDNILHIMQRTYDTSVADMDRFILIGADPNATGRSGQSLFQAAVQLRRPLEWLKYLLTVNTVPFPIDDDGNTIVHLISQHERILEDIDSVLDLAMKTGADPLSKNKRGQSVFHTMAPANAQAILNSPYFKDLAVNEQDIDGFTPLHYVCSETAVADLLSKGADASIKTNNGMSPLHCAAKVGESCAAELLISQYRTLSTLSQEINALVDGKSPLHYACQAGSCSVVAVLLRAGADPGLVDQEGWSPLHILSKYIPEIPEDDNRPSISRTPEIVQMLSRRGININATVTHKFDDESSPIQATALDLAVEAKRWELVRELITCGATVLERYRGSQEFLLNTDKDLALAAAKTAKANQAAEMSGLSEDEINRRCYHNHPWRGRWSSAYEPESKVRGWILDPEDIVAEGQYSSEALTAALEEYEFDVVTEYYIAGGEILKGPERIGDFMKVVLFEGYESLLRYIVESHLHHSKHTPTDGEGATTVPGFTLLGTCFNNPYPSMHLVEWLVDEIGVDIDGKHREFAAHGDTTWTAPLHILAKGSSFWHIEALEYLISKGANIEMKNSKGKTPLRIALDEGRSRGRSRGRWQFDVARVLLRSGANTNVFKNKSIFSLIKDPKLVKLVLASDIDVSRHVAFFYINIMNSMVPESVKALLDAGADPNEVPQEGPYYPYYCDSDELSDLSDNDGCKEKKIEDINSIESYYYRYALHEAATTRSMEDHHAYPRQDRIAVMDLLLSSGADPFLTYSDGSFILQQIVRDRGLAKECLSLMKEHKLDHRGRYGRTLLIEASIPAARRFAPQEYDERNEEEKENEMAIMSDVVKLLMDLGADVALVDEQGRTALHWMCTHSLPFDLEAKSVFTALLAKNPKLIEMEDNEGRTPLSLALESYSSKHVSLDFAVRELVAAGADMRILHPISGDSALHYVAKWLVKDEKERADEARALFSDLATVLDINLRNKAGASVLATALATPYPPTKGRYPSWYADGAETSVAEMIEFLVHLGASVDTVDAKGRGLLHVAAQRQINEERYSEWYEEEMIEKAFVKLLDLGLDPHLEDDEHRTPIDIAVARRLQIVVNLFSEEGRRAAEERKVKDESAEGDSASSPEGSSWDSDNGDEYGE